MSKRDQLLSRSSVESRIANGEILVIYHGKVLKLNNWLNRHPGGDKAVLHMVGRDASDEIDVYHAEETKRVMAAFQIGRVEMPWKNFVPPIQGGHFRTLAEMDQDEAIALSSGSTPTSRHGQKCRSSGEYGIDYSSLNESTAKVMDDYDNARLAADKLKYPKVDIETQRAIVEKFRRMHHEFVEEGFFQCNYWGYFREACRIGTLFFLAYYLFGYKDRSKLWLFLSAVCLGLAWHQLTFIAHDAGHLAITHGYQADNVIGTIIADFLGGLSLGWWKRNHNVHHLVTNDPVHDPDIQHLPFFAVSSKFFGDIKSSFYERVLYFDAVAKKFIPYQNYLYYVILTFGRFNLYRLSWEYLILGLGPRRGKGAWLRYLEIAGMATFFYWFFYLVVTCSLDTAGERWLYVMVSHMVTMPVHVQITLSHFAMSTSDLGPDEAFAQKQLRTTMDVDCPEWFDFAHGGLQFQAIHHLFPRMPRHNLRAAQAKVKKFCDEVGLEYCIYGFTRGNQYVISHLGDVAKQARILAECNNFCRDEMLGKLK
ncbi:hypothetical protein TRVA0_035S01618 [Trichomonascus vanleenenianus]|uniref:uncharacterized protein n=1 Tax=Trichomonascus vanleenenianus TaxID=2268995 RepID=UPI003ECA139B